MLSVKVCHVDWHLKRGMKQMHGKCWFKSWVLFSPSFLLLHPDSRGCFEYLGPCNARGKAGGSFTFCAFSQSHLCLLRYFRSCSADGSSLSLISLTLPLKLIITFKTSFFKFMGWQWSFINIVYKFQVTRRQEKLRNHHWHTSKGGENKGKIWAEI